MLVYDFAACQGCARPTDFTEARMAQLALRERFKDQPSFGFLDWVLRGIAQVVFQNNPVTGAVILAGIYYNSWIYGTACLAGAMISTATALLLKADRGLIKDGLYGFKDRKSTRL